MDNNDKWIPLFDSSMHDLRIDYENENVKSNKK